MDCSAMAGVISSLTRTSRARSREVERTRPSIGWSVVTAPKYPAHKDLCPDAEDLAALADGRLQSAERARLEAHLADCDRCRPVFAGLAELREEPVEQSVRPHAVWSRRRLMTAGT